MILLVVSTQNLMFLQRYKVQGRNKFNVIMRSFYPCGFFYFLCWYNHCVSVPTTKRRVPYFLSEKERKKYIWELNGWSRWNIFINFRHIGIVWLLAPSTMVEGGDRSLYNNCSNNEKLTSFQSHMQLIQLNYMEEFRIRWAVISVIHSSYCAWMQ